MKREEYAKKINCQMAELTRLQGTNYEENWKEGDILEVGKDLGLCWTDGGIFTPEGDKEYTYLLKAFGNIECHKVDYNNEKEVYDIGATDCKGENEHLIPVGTKFKVISEPQDIDFEEMGYYTVELELIVEN